MQKTITFLDSRRKRAFYTDNLEYVFEFSVIDSSLIGTPRERPDKHTLHLTLSDRLINNWNLEHDSGSGITLEMVKVAFQSAEDYISDYIKKGMLKEKELPGFYMHPGNSPALCPYKISNIYYPEKKSFEVNIENNNDDNSLKKCFDDFAYYIQSEKRMTFWDTDDKNNKKWIPKPEKLAKDLLHSFLKGRFINPTFIFEELTAGAGRIDIFIITPNAERIVVELKMCGKPYSKNYALGGTDQLTHYMENKNAKEGFLIVFDSRKRDYGTGFQDIEQINDMKITTIISDLRPYITKRINN